MIGRHPNDVARRSRVASWIMATAMLFLAAGFFRSQVIRHASYALQSESNRLREVPVAAARGMILDRHNAVIANNVAGYSISVFALQEDTLRAVVQRLSHIIAVPPSAMDRALRQFRRTSTRPAVVVADASQELVTMVEAHRAELPGLVVESAPRRFYPDGPVVASFAGFVGEVNEAELATPAMAGYKAGQQVGKQGLEQEYESTLRGKEGSRFVEVDSQGQVVKSTGARQDLAPIAGADVHTNIDLALQRVIAKLFADSLQGGVVALDPNTGGVLAFYSAPSWSGNRFIGGVPAAYWDSLLRNPRRPLYNKALQAVYAPGSTWKLATAVMGLETNMVRMTDHMPIACTGGMQVGSRYFRCWDAGGHGSLDLKGAIAKSCDVYFYQLGIKLGLSRLVAGGVAMGFARKSGIDLPGEIAPRFPESTGYFDRKYGRAGWTNALALNMAIGQGDNAQTMLGMAKFYAALATDGKAPRPSIAVAPAERTELFRLSAQQLEDVRDALVAVTAGGTAARLSSKGLQLAGKNGTAQSGTVDPATGRELNHSWFVGFAPANKPSIVVAVMIEFGGHGPRAAAIASRIIQAYLHVAPVVDMSVEG